MEIIGLLKELVCLFKEVLAYLKEKREADGADLPDHMDTTQVYTYLKMDKATFYRSVYMHKLMPCTYAGSRPYYKKADVIALMNDYGTHEKGAQTYGKKSRKKAQQKKKA
ncbi:hypothetical protein SAMN05216436_1327 [bacterium A37T11]|nr:hypothetical protein SAMN05216436_1327 [bacterium A37T11]